MNSSVDLHSPVNNPAPKSASDRGRRVSHAEFLKLWNDPSLTTEEIGQRLQITQSNVCKRARARGLPPRKGFARIAIHDTALFTEMWNEGVFLQDMARHFDVSPSNIKRTRKRLGLPLRGKGNWDSGKTLDVFFQERLSRRMARTALQDQRMMVNAQMISLTKEARAFFRSRGQRLI